MDLRSEDLFEALASGKPPHLLIVVGTASDRRPVVEDFLRRLHGREFAACMDHSSYDAAEPDACAALIQEACTFPFLRSASGAPVRSVHVKDAAFLLGTGKKEKDEEGEDSGDEADAPSPAPKTSAAFEAFAGFAQQAPAFAFIVLELEKLGKRKGIEGADVVRCEAPPSDRGLAAWIAQRARQRKLPLDPRLSQAIADASGPSSAAVDNALDKLESARRPDGSLPSVLELLPLVQGKRGDNVFRFLEAVATAQTGAAVESAEALLRYGMTNFDGSVERDPVPVFLRTLSMLAKELRNLRAASAILASGRGPDSVKDALKLNPYPLKKVLGSARKRSPEAWRRGYDKVVDLEHAFKSGRVPDINRAMTLLAVELTRA